MIDLIDDLAVPSAQEIPSSLLPECSKLTECLPRQRDCKCTNIH